MGMMAGRMKGARGREDTWLRIPPDEEEGGREGARSSSSGGSQKVAAIMARRSIEGAHTGPRKENIPSYA